MEKEEYLSSVQFCTIGKQLPAAVYLHQSATKTLTPHLADLIIKISTVLNLNNHWNVLKLYRNEFRLSFLSYNEFDLEPYPQLLKSYSVDLSQLKMEERNYNDQTNPPILHRKETMVEQDYPYAEEFRLVTKEGEAAGLYADISIIGHRESWLFLIRKKGYELVDGRLFRSSAVDTQHINRERTAISRFNLSAPLQAANKQGLLNGEYTFLDYGCGRGDDMSILEDEGIDVIGWDPNFRPSGMCSPRDIVNLGYVINVIEDRVERAEALTKAWLNTKKALIVSAMIASERQIERFTPYKDGVITSRNTFQKYYTQDDLREYIGSVLSVTPLPLTSGVFIAFRDDELEFKYLANRYRRKPSTRVTRVPKKTKQEKLQEKISENSELFDEYWKRCLELGRFPNKIEEGELATIRELIPSPKVLKSLLLSTYQIEDLRESEQRVKEDLTLIHAMSKFNGRTNFINLPEDQKTQIRHFYGTYRQLQGESLALLNTLPDINEIFEATTEFLKEQIPHFLEPNKSLTIHKYFEPNLPVLLRAYIGCARQLFGEMDDIDLIKLHLATGKVSFMGYNNFDNKPIPMLRERIKVDLWNQRVHYYDYVDDYKPKPLYWRSKFISCNFLNFKKQKSFDEKLELYGLAPDNPSFGLDLLELDRELTRRKLTIRGFRFYNNKDQRHESSKVTP